MGLLVLFERSEGLGENVLTAGTAGEGLPEPTAPTDPRRSHPDGRVSKVPGSGEEDATDRAEGIPELGGDLLTVRPELLNELRDGVVVAGDAHRPVAVEVEVDAGEACLEEKRADAHSGSP